MALEFGLLSLMALLLSPWTHGQDRVVDHALDPSTPVMDFFLRHPEFLGEVGTSPLVCRVETSSLADAALSYLRADGDRALLTEGVMCTDLFSITPPGALAPFQERLATLGGWRPLCSLTNLRLNAHDAVGRGRTFEQVLEQYSSDQRGMDTCDNPVGSAHFHAALDTAAATTRATAVDEGLRARVTEINHRVRDQVRDLCCGTENADCREYFDHVSLTFCSELSEETSQSYCAHYGAVSTDTWNQGRSGLPFFGSSSAFRRDRHVPEGDDSLRVSSSINVAENFFERFPGAHGDRILTHEYGHVCSSYRSYAGARARRPSEAWLLHTRFVQPRLNLISDEIREAYGERYRSIGLNDDSVECLLGVAAMARVSRYSPVHACEGTDPRQQLEEMFASLTTTRLLAEAHMPEVFQIEICGGIRDGVHAAVADATACALRTPAYRHLLERASRCRH